MEREETSRALRRELAEELGIEAAPTVRLGSVRVYDSNHILVVWRVRHVSGAIQIAHREVSEVRWLAPDQIRRLDPDLPSNERVLRMLRT